MKFAFGVQQGGASTSDVRSVANAVGPSGSQPPQPGQLPIMGMQVRQRQSKINCLTN